MPQPVTEIKAPDPSLPKASRYQRWRAIFAGLAAAGAGVGVAEVVAVVVSPRASPLASTGAFIIDLSPSWLKEIVISLFGTADKVVIIVAVALLVAVLAALAGIVEASRPPFGRAIIVGVGALGLFAAVTRADSTMLSPIPSVVAATIAIMVLVILTRRSHAIEKAKSEREQDAERRTFLISASLAAGIGIIAAFGGRIAATSIQAVDVARRKFKLPIPVVSVAPLPSGVSLDVPGISPVVTPNRDFYRIDTALIVPSVDPQQWSLKITGMVDHEVTLNFGELLELPLEESYTTLTCVSNYVGGDLIGNALWLGYPIRKLLEKAGPKSGADMVLSRSIDGFTAGTPLTALTDDRNAILAVAMNGEPLPAEHGFPVRMVVPGLYGYVSATKWVTELKVTTFAKDAAYWTHRGWGERGPVKLSSRIDTPKDSFQATAGTVMVAGVAWSQHVGIAKVEIKVDDGAWMEATLAQAISTDTWVQWAFPWEATRGRHSLTVRTTDAKGMLQIADYADVVPDGATGYHSINVGVA